MIMFTLQIVDTHGNTIPAVLFSNSIFNKYILEERFGKSVKITANYSCEADDSQVPLETILYSQQQEIDLVLENHGLHEENFALKAEITELKSKLMLTEIDLEKKV